MKKYRQYYTIGLLAALGLTYLLIITLIGEPKDDHGNPTHIHLAYIKKCIVNYHDRFSIFPDDLNDHRLLSLGACQLLTKYRVDPWGNSIRYINNVEAFEIISAGADEIFGTEYDIRISGTVLATYPAKEK